MDCHDLEQLLSEGPLADLTPEQRAGAEAHLAECAACRERWDPVYESRQLHVGVKELGRPSSVKTTVMARIAGTTPPAAADPPEAPKQIGGYEVLGFVGRGGMGNVFKARQVSMDRLVALKILPSRLASNGAFVERLTREARAAARLSHPNIVHAYDVGEADGHYYFAMEYVDGEGLDAVLRREGPLEQNRARRLMMQVASALAAAHEAGVIHRDVKPSNILLDRKGRARVADFGLAKRLEGDATTAAIGESLGTPAYAAPEVCRGAEIDARADLYSLGATFFHLLAGRPPFEDADAARVLVRQVKDDPPALAAVAPRVDPRLCRIIDRLLRKEPSERHPSARALLDELEALGRLRPNGGELQEAPTESLRPGQKLLREFEAEQGRGPRWTRRRLALVGGATAACIALALILWRGGGPRGGRPSGRAKGKEAATAIEPTPGERNEHNAQVVLERAQRAATLGQWVTVARELDRLAQAYSETEVYRTHRVTIAELRARAERELGAGVVTPTQVAVGKPILVPGEWTPLFDGESLDGWRVVEQFHVEAKHGDGRGGEVRVADGQIVLGVGRPATGIAWTREFPRADYEVVVEAMQTARPDTFELIFPIGESHCQLAAPGFGGGVVGLSFVDNRWGNGNVTTRHMGLPRGKWYRVRLRVTLPRIEAWIDEEKVIDLPTEGHTFSTPSDRDPLLPFGIAVWSTSAAVRSVGMRRLEPGDGPVVPEEPGEWVSLFDGQTLKGWAVEDEGAYAKHGEVRVDEGRIVLGAGDRLTGIGWLEEFPTTDYELSLEAVRVAGKLDFCSLDFPVGESFCSMLVGSWGGTAVGLELVDGRKASENETTREMTFEQGRWYRVRLRVTGSRVEAWIDDEQVVDLATEGHTLAVQEWRQPAPRLRIFSWETTSALRDTRVRRITPEPPALPERPSDWFALFDGKSLRGWRVVGEGEFAGHGTVRVAEGLLVLGQGISRTGLAWRGDFPTVDYEVALEVRRDDGPEFCEILFPAGSERGIWSLGAWGGGGAGVSNLDGVPGLANDTFRPVALRTGQWYQVRLRVAGGRMEGWLDEDKLLDLATAGRTLTSPSWFPVPEPFGLKGWRTALSVRSLKLRLLESKQEEPPADGTPVETASLAVWAGAGWFPTGLFLTKGKAYEIQASGRWGAHASWSSGPDGRRRTEFVPYPLLGTHQYDLIGRIGAHGRPFRVGSRRQVEAQGPGQLYLGMNDDSPPDNWGSLRVDLRGPMVAGQDAPLIARFTKELGKVEVGPGGAWVDSGVELRRGDRVLLRAEGTWAAGPGLGAVDADGFDRAWRGQRAGALLGRLGQHGEIFVVGKLRLLEARQSGKLYLTVNQSRRVVPMRFEGPIERGPIELLDGGEAAPPPRPPAPGFQGDMLRRARPAGDVPDQPAAAGPEGDVQGTLTVTVLGPADFEPRPAVQDELHVRLLATLQGHTSWVISVAFSPDGKLLASGSRDRTVRLWDASTGECLRTLQGHGDTVESVAFTPDGKQLVSASRDGTLRVWDMATSECVHELPGHNGPVRSVAVFPDGARAASSGDDGTVRIWDLPTGKSLQVLAGQEPSWCVAVSPDGAQVAVATEQGRIRIWDADTGQLKTLFFAQAPKCWCLLWSPDGTRLISGGDAPALKVWEPATGRRLQSLEVGGAIRGMAYSPDGKHIASGGWYRVLRLWDATTFELCRSVEDHTTEVRGIAFSSDSKRLATASFDGTVKLWAVGPDAAPEAEPADPARQ